MYCLRGHTVTNQEQGVVGHSNEERLGDRLNDDWLALVNIYKYDWVYSRDIYVCMFGILDPLSPTRRLPFVSFNVGIFYCWFSAYSKNKKEQTHQRMMS